MIGCVAIERLLNIYKGVHFNKNRSRQVAKWAISLVFLLTLLTHMHDPWHRHTIDDEEDQWLLCLSQYSRSLQIYDWIINIIHFAFPFLINLILALMIIFISAREPWLYLIGYYISFTPSMLNFIIFVLPSNTYSTQFDHSIRNLWCS